MKYFTFFILRIRKDETKVILPLKFKIEEVKILVRLLG